MRSRIFNIMQYEVHPETGEPLLNENTIKTALLSHRTVTRWAYICHDKDVYSALDEEQNPDHHQGNVKPRHWHIVVELKNNAAEITTIAKWFKIKDNYVETAKGAGAFLDCVQYLTHESDKQQHLGKRLYEDIEVQANFNFRDELDKRAERRLKYGADLDPAQQMMFDVLHNGKTLAQCDAEDPVLYTNIFDRLARCRQEYLKMCPAPKYRLNYYVSGSGGVGKGLISKALARAFYPNIVKDEEIFYEIGSGSATFEKYDGQPVIIWNDCRYDDLLKRLGSRGNVFDVFDSHPTDSLQNIKYGSVKLLNQINIVNSAQTYSEFLDGLAGAYVDKKGVYHSSEDDTQSYRRFPMIFCVHQKDFDMLLSKGFVEDTDNFKEYLTYRQIGSNFARMAKTINDKVLRREIETKALEPAIENGHNKLVAHEENKSDDEEAIRKEFADVGVPQSIGKTWYDEDEKVWKEETIVGPVSTSNLPPVTADEPGLPPDYYDNLEPPLEDDEYFPEIAVQDVNGNTVKQICMKGVLPDESSTD